MSSTNKKHIHKYYRSYSPSGQFLWTCAFMDCSHHMPKHYEHTLLGRGTTCWGRSDDCTKTFAFDDRSLNMDKPLCESCDPRTNLIGTVEALKEYGVVNKLD